MDKSKRQLRAEAVKRLKNLKDGMFCYTDAAAVVGINGYVNADMFRDALIELLTDNDEHDVREGCKMKRVPFMGWECSKCGKINAGMFSEHGNQAPNFCPNCGEEASHE